MILTCQDMLNNPIFEKIKLVAGEGGISHAITWIYIKQTKSLAGWINGGEIVFVVEKTANKDRQFFEEFMEECSRLNVSAIIFLIGGEDYVSAIPEYAKEYANVHELPLFEMDSCVRILDVTRELSNIIFLWHYKNRQTENFLMDLLHSDNITGLEYKKDGFAYGFNLSRNYVVSTFCNKDYIEAENEVDGFVISNRYVNLGVKLKLKAEYCGEQCFCVQSCGVLVVYFSCENKEKRKNFMKGICELLREYNQVSNSNIMAGYSSLHSSIEQIPIAYEEARKTLRYTLKNGFGRICCAYEDMGILRFLLADRDKEDILQYCESVLADIKEIDGRDKTEYMSTLWMYLKMNNNLVQTSQKLYIHRNTLLNRINKIQQVTGRDLSNPYVKQEYMNVFTILEFMGKL